MKDHYLWCDFIERTFLSTQFKQLLDKGHIFGATSNPTIFFQALSSPAYQESISQLKATQTPAKDIYESLVVEDIKQCAQMLLPLWEKNKATGYISLEIDPNLANDVSFSIVEARALFERIGMPNVMIKVPATPNGIKVMERLAEGEDMPLNATLVFSPEQARLCALALRRAPMAVVSIFVSRIDTPANELLKNRNLSLGTQQHLQNKIGIGNALACYEQVREVSNTIYPLFASTGVKDPSLPKDYYLQALKLEHSISTAPLEALHAYYNEPSPPPTLFKNLSATATDLLHSNLYSELLEKGLDAFKSAFSTILARLN
ncbi:transaldolase family protein [Helicobacter bizzozeronii]|uniref:transaldolase family protein n=1 Tax=Helicobacter bizzozeronii TaxID=56877 RepID=UPI000CEF5630|nr:transaldolase family protein [Helicobacter bizzozeronii]